MPDIPRLNGVIKALEEGKVAFTTFTPADIESAIALANFGSPRLNLNGIFEI